MVFLLLKHPVSIEQTNAEQQPMSKLAAIKRRELVTRDDFASAIAQRWQDSVVATIDVGKLLLGAKAALSHGEFTPMVEDRLPFGESTARRLMAIAEHSILSKRAHGHVLPPAWRTVYELTRAPDEPLLEWLADGTIHPEMKRKDVLSLLRSLRSSTRKAITSRKGRYNLILADPPWKYDFFGTDSRRIENQYETQIYTDIAEDPEVLNFIDEDCVLFLWATSPKLIEAGFVLNAWKFDYKTSSVWVKDRIGMGYYFRNRHEYLLVGTRGSISPPEESARPDSVLEAPRTKHSQKPEQVYERIDQMYPEFADETHRIELYAREKREGWSCWGNEWQPPTEAFD